MRTFAAVVLAGLCLAVALPAAAQDAGAGQQWYQVFYFKFVPGMKERALAHVVEHFVPVDMAIGRKTIAFDLATGEWDHVAYFPATVGPEGIDSVPSWQVWRAELARREGGKAAADKVFADYFAMVAEHKVELARLLGPPPQ